MDKLQKCHDITLSIIEQITAMPENISDEQREVTFVNVSEQFTQRGTLIEALKKSGINSESELYQEFMRSDEQLVLLIKGERERLLGISRKIEKNRKVIGSYLK